MVVRLMQRTLLCLSLSALTSRGAGVETNLPFSAAPRVPLVTNVVAQRIVKDTIQALLEVTPVAEAAESPGRAAGTNWAAAVAQAHLADATLITNACAGFVPGSLAETIGAAFHTNGRSPRMWERSHLPPGWPAEPPVLRWNTNSLLWDRKGMTAISQVCEGMGAFGQGAITALTRRHGYVRGHGMGPSGLDSTRVGRKVWFCTRDNRLVERKMELVLIRFMDSGHVRDYSLILFDADLPPEIEPMRVVDSHAREARVHGPATGLCQRAYRRVEHPDTRRGLGQPMHAAAAGRSGLCVGSLHLPAQRRNAGRHGHAQPEGRPGHAPLPNAMG